LGHTRCLFGIYNRSIEDCSYTTHGSNISCNYKTLLHSLIFQKQGIREDKDISNKKPKDNKFHKGNGADGKHYWLTPPEVYTELNEEFNFNFDPCPYPLPEGFDGLTCEWGESNYCNPPFGSIMHEGKKKGPTAWARKAIEEHKKGKDVVMVYPMDKWVLMMIEAGAEIRNLGDVKWLATEDRSQGKGLGRHIACFVLKHKE